MLANPLDSPRLSSRLLGDTSKIASKQEKENGIRTCWPTYRIQSMIAKQISGFAILEKITEVEELRKVPIR